MSIKPEDVDDNALYSVVISDYDATRFEQNAEKLGIAVARDDGYYT